MINLEKVPNTLAPVDGWDKLAVDDFLGFYEGVTLLQLARYKSLAGMEDYASVKGQIKYYENALSTIKHLRHVNSTRKVDDKLCHRDVMPPIS